VGRFTLVKDNETGRIRKKQLHERTCKYCLSGDVEDELHFVCYCSCYNEVRLKMFNDINRKYPD
jgi:hypothetical protein